ncbi:MFS transporter [Nocardioides sp. NPDC127503]|uniref:MFS transporter n=1 Tax=Nocardioides sp. NPDC127503 TaxID=3154516 RepID=UPI0033250467
MSFKLQHITDDATAATGALGTILGIGGLVSLIACPLAGRLSDRTASRFGRRRPWIVGGAIVAFLSLLANLGFS